MPHANNSRVKSRTSGAHAEEELAVKEEAVPMKSSRVVDLVEEEEIVSPIADERAEGAAVEESDGEESPAPEDEELDTTELNPFGDKWEE